MWDWQGDQLRHVHHVGDSDLEGHRAVHDHNLLNVAFHQPLHNLRG